MIKKLYKSFFPLINLIPPELAHNLAIRYLSNYKKKETELDDPILNTNICDLKFSNPIGLAAGFDKNGKSFNGLFNLGFGFVEIGTVTLKPQVGNKKPRIFRLLEDKAIINRLGFNNDGAQNILKRIQKKNSSESLRILGVNIGKNFDTTSFFEDYKILLKIFYKDSNYITLNVSSPNTPGLRELQEKDNLDQLVKSICLEKRKYSLNVPIFIKIDPDLSDSSLKDIADIVLGSNINGVIISNTSIKRSNKLVSKYALEKGGISGKPLLEISNEALRKFYILTNGKVPLIGVGGISSGKDVYEKILNGASLVQMYTALVYYGPGIIKKIKDELIFLLKKDKYKSISSAVGKLNR